MSISDLNWEGKSKEMYDAILSAAPGFMKQKAEEGFKEWVEKKGIDTMTEALIEEHIKETVPSPIQGMVLGKIAPYKTG